MRECVVWSQLRDVCRRTGNNAKIQHINVKPSAVRIVIGTPYVGWEDGPIAKAVWFGDAMRTPVVTRLVGAFGFVEQLQLMIVVATTADATNRPPVYVLGFDCRMMRRALATTLPVVEQWACQHDRCHDCGNDLPGEHRKSNLRV